VHAASVLANEDGPARDIVLLNAGAALYCANVAATMAEGVSGRARLVSLGAALAQALTQFVAATKRLAGA
jgi:anthranilate phosphoribosyltransferase